MESTTKSEVIKRDWDQDRLEEYIKQLSLWETTPSLEWLVGGLINRNWVVHDGGKKYVARVFFDAESMNVSEQSVLACSRAASDLGVTPKLRYAEPHLTVVDFIDGRILTEKELTDEKIVEQCMKKLQTLHAGTRQIRSPINYHWRFLNNRNLVRWSIENSSPHADQVKTMLPYLDQLEPHMRPFLPCLTHNDLAHVNVMLENTGGMWLIDWDFGAVGHPLTDISDFLSYGPPTEDIERHALRCYLPANTSESEFEQTYKEYLVSLLMSYCFQYTWAAVVDHSVQKSAEDIKESMEMILPDQEASYQGFMAMAKQRFDETWKRCGHLFA